MGYLEKKLLAIVSTINAWKYKSGNLYVMTSDSAPSPFVASKSNLDGSAYMAFNNNSGNSVYKIIQAITSGYSQLLFNKEVKVKTISIVWSSTTADRAGLRCQLLVNGSWTDVASYSTGTQTVSLAGTLATGIRFYFATQNSSEYHNFGCSKMQVTEWYE